MRDWPPVVAVQYRRAVLVDRDGTINIDTHYPHRVEELELLPRAAEALAMLAPSDFAVVVVSNQAGIAKGLYDRDEMRAFNRAIRERVERAGGRIDAFYFCPEPEAADLPPGAPLAACTKPNPGMLLEAASDFGFDLARSYAVGDKSSDVEAGCRAGCTSILVETGYAGREPGALETRPDLLVPDLAEAVDAILSAR